MTSEKKKAFVQRLAKQIQTFPVIALVNMQNLPTKQLQNMRKQLLKKDIFIIMARKKLLQLALKNSEKQNIEQLIQKMKGMPALLLAKENPFTLYSILQKSKSFAPAKPNQISPKDIFVPAGPTSFAPGPIISELASVGIKTKVEGGKLVIVQDTNIIKEGEAISPKLAEILKRLDIQPMEVGLNLVAAWENSLIFDAKQLYIDEAEYFKSVTLAFQEAFNLAIEIAYPTSDNIELLLQKAFQESKTLALEQDILTDLTAEEILVKIEQQALVLKETAGIEIIEKMKGETKEVEKAPVEKKKEEKAEEKKEEVEAGEEIKEYKEEKEKPQIMEAPEPGEKPAEEEEEPKKEVEEIKEKPEAEKKAEEVKEEKKEKKKPKTEDIPSTQERIKAAKEEIVEGTTSAEEMIQAMKERFDPSLAKEPQPTAEQLVEEEREKAEKEKPKKDEDVEKAESLFEKLKKQGTLRKNNDQK